MKCLDNEDLSRLFVYRQPHGFETFLEENGVENTAEALEQAAHTIRLMDLHVFGSSQPDSNDHCPQCHQRYEEIAIHGGDPNAPKSSGIFNG